MRSGFVAVVGRTGVGKSALVNAMVGTKVTITSKHPNTTRFPVHGILNRPGIQAVFVDTPGFHKPKTRLGERLNSVAEDSLAGVDVAVFVVDASASIGPGDLLVAAKLGKSAICVVNKTDKVKGPQLVSQLIKAAEWDFSEYFPVSARTGKGVSELVETISARLPVGPAYYSMEEVTGTSEVAWVAELVREALLARVRQELPHSMACRVIEWEWPYVRCEILVERESQKPIVIGRNGTLLKEVGIAARKQLPEGTYLDLVVKVEKDWQSNDRAIGLLGYGPDGV
ncbi:MAG TPA: GTPase Era [Acidimicrobiales bacterium]|nr:GTPase Era [Acidimicrobiales bacterium]